MERIKLSKREKNVLRTLAAQGFDALSDFDYSAIRTLHNHGLVRGAFMEGGEVEGAKLTTKGKEYMLDNPKLHNPIDWGKVAAIGSIMGVMIAAAALFVSLFVACSLKKNYYYEQENSKTNRTPASVQMPFAGASGDFVVFPR